MIMLSLLFSCNGSRPGCTDPDALNYDPDATEDNGSCIYPEVSLEPLKSLDLSEQLNETSGLIYWNGSLFTHNDQADIQLYQLDTSSAVIETTYSLTGASNNNWEDLCQDSEYIYVGDFGNNLSGNRQDLHVLRVEKEGLLADEIRMDTIWFRYSDQEDYSPSAPNQTEFDCEAIISWGGQLFLFTKQWISGKTSLYSLPKTPGNHIAVKQDSYQVDGLVSGASVFADEGLVVLCAYDKLLQPFLVLLSDFKDQAFFSGHTRKVILSLPFHQVEGIAAAENRICYITNESYSLPTGSLFPQKCHRLDLSPLLD